MSTDSIDRGADYALYSGFPDWREIIVKIMWPTLSVPRKQVETQGLVVLTHMGEPMKY